MEWVRSGYGGGMERVFPSRVFKTCRSSSRPVNLREDAVWLGLGALLFLVAAGLAVGTDFRNMPGGEIALRIVATLVAFGGVLVLTFIFAAHWWERF